MAVFERMGTFWNRDPKGVAIDLLRIGVGVIWAFNLIFILAPSNQYFATFQSSASSFAPTTLGGPSFANFVATYPGIFSWVIAILTFYLAFAFLFGFTTRLACIVGGLASLAFLLTQWTSTIVLNGSGTDVGAHPLYILIYLVLFAAGAGQYLALDRWIWASGHAHVPGFSRWIASPPPPDAVIRTPTPSRGGPRPVPGAFPLTARTLLVYAAAGVLVSFAVGGGLVMGLPMPQNGSSNTPLEVNYVNLTININASNGWPQYSPANFSVPAGQDIFTIVDNDQPMNWTGCPCPVRGTVGNVEEINGTPVKVVPSANVAHGFAVPALGLSVWSPGGSTVQFTADLLNPGNFSWMCEVPCGAGANPYATPPMGTPGYMMGTMTVTS